MGPALLLAAALSAAPEGAPPASTHGRLVLSADAGGGWASDAYLGADMGESGLAQLAPTARLDLSLSPRLKAAAGVGVNLSRLPRDDFGSAGITAGGELRLVGRSAEGALALAADAARYSAPTPLGTASGPGVTATAAALIAPVVRLRHGALSARLGVTGELRRSRTDAGDVDERGLSASATVGGTVRQWLLLEAGGQAEHVQSDAPDFAHRSAGLSGTATAATVARGPEVALELGALRTRFDTARDEKLLRASLEVAQPAGPVQVIVAWSGARSDATSGGAPDAVARRQVWYLGVRGRRQVLTW